MFRKCSVQVPFDILHDLHGDFLQVRLRIHLLPFILGNIHSIIEGTETGLSEPADQNIDVEKKIDVIRMRQHDMEVLLDIPDLLQNKLCIVFIEFLPLLHLQLAQIDTISAD